MKAYKISTEALTIKTESYRNSSLFSNIRWWIWLFEMDCSDLRNWICLLPISDSFRNRYRLSLFFYNNEQAEIGLGAGEKQYQIQSRIRQRYPSLYTQGFDASAVLLLLPVEDAKADDWNQQLALLREDLNEFFGVPFSFTISDIYTSPVDLVRAYQQIQCIKVYSAYNRYSVLENAEASQVPNYSASSWHWRIADHIQRAVQW